MIAYLQEHIVRFIVRECQKHTHGRIKRDLVKLLAVLTSTNCQCSVRGIMQRVP